MAMGSGRFTPKRLVLKGPRHVQIRELIGARGLEPSSDQPALLGGKSRNVQKPEAGSPVSLTWDERGGALRSPLGVHILGAFPALRNLTFSHAWCNLGPVAKNPSANAGDVRAVGSIPGWGRSPGGGHGNPLQCSCLENPMDRGAWRAAVHAVAKSKIQGQ